MVNVSRLDAFERESNGEALLYAQDPITPMEMRLLDLSGDRPSAPAVLRRMPALFDATGLVVTRHDATAQDGERIPYVQVGPARQDGAAAGASLRLRRLRGLGETLLPLPHRQALAGARRRQRRRQYPGRRRVRAALAQGRRARGQAHRAGRFRRRRRRSRQARRRPAEPHRRGGRLQRRAADRQYADAPSREIRRACSARSRSSTCAAMRSFWPGRAGSRNTAIPTSPRTGRS